MCLFFFFQPQPVVWRENQAPGTIITLIAKDNDGPENGPPFTFSLANSASEEIRTKFDILGMLRTNNSNKSIFYVSNLLFLLELKSFGLSVLKEDFISSYNIFKKYSLDYCKMSQNIAVCTGYFIWCFSFPIIYNH